MLNSQLKHKKLLLPHRRSQPLNKLLLRVMSPPLHSPQRNR